jgi:hypothetical protein
VTDTSARPFSVRAGQVWAPAAHSRAKPRRVAWTGHDRCYGNAVRWMAPDEQAGGMIQFKAFVAWVRKHGATCDD